MKTKSERIREAFAKASEELGHLKVKGRGHVPRTTLKSVYSRYASEGTNNWDYICPGKEQVSRRYFPLELVKKAAEIGGFEVEEKVERVPIYKSEEIPCRSAYASQRGDDCFHLHENVFIESGKYYLRTQIIGYSILHYWRCRSLGVSTIEKQREEFLEEAFVLPPLPNPKDNLFCMDCKYFSPGASFCAVQPSFVFKADSCPDYESADKTKSNPGLVDVDDTPF